MNLMKSRKSILFTSQISSLPSIDSQKKFKLSRIQNHQSNKKLQNNEDDPMNPDNQAQQTQIIPRVFPNDTIPIKVQIARRIKQYQGIDLNFQFKRIDFGQLGWGKGNLELFNFEDERDFIYEYAINKRNSKKKFLKGRAYNKKTQQYENFSIIDYKIQKGVYYFIGNFVRQQSSSNDKKLNYNSIGSINKSNTSSPVKSINNSPIKKLSQQDIIQLKLQSKIQTKQKIARIYICFSFQNPKHYLSRLKNAIGLRNRILERIKFQFYLDNFQKDYDLKISNTMLKQIEKYVNYSNSSQTFGTSYQDLCLINSLYHESMARIQFINFLKNQELNSEQLQQNNPYEGIIIPKQIKNAKNFKTLQIKQKYIKIKQGQKVFKLIPKTFKTKLEQFKGKFMYAEDYITDLMNQVKKIILNIKSIKIYDHLKRKQFTSQFVCTLDKFVSDQIYAFQNANTFIHECVIDPLVFLIKQTLKKVNDGWFKLLYPSLATYNASRLKRMFLVIQQMIKTQCRSLIQNQMKILNDFMKNYVFQQNKQDKQYKGCQQNLQNEDAQEQFELQQSEKGEQQFPSLVSNLQKAQKSVISIIVHLNKNHFTVQLNKQKYLKQMKLMMNFTLGKMHKLSSPEYIVMQHLFGKLYEQKIELDFPTVQILQNLCSGTNWKWSWITQQMKQYLNLIDKISNNLGQVQKYLSKLQKKINLEMILLNQESSFEQIQVVEIEEYIKLYESLIKKVQSLIPLQKLKVDFYLFQIDFHQLRQALADKINSIIFQLKKKLVIKTIHFMKKIEYELQQIQKQACKNAANVKELIERLDYLNNIPQTIKSLNINQMTFYFQMTIKFQCYLNQQDMDRYWNNLKYLKTIQESRIFRIKYCNQRKKNAIIQLQKQVEDLFERLSMFDNTNLLIQHQIVKKQSEVLLVYQKIYDMCVNLSKQHEIIQEKSKDIIYKQKKLSLPESNVLIVQRMKKQKQNLFQMWNGIKIWEDNKKIWMYAPLSSFQVKLPQETLQKILNNWKQVQIFLKAVSHSQINQGKLSYNENQNMTEKTSVQPNDVMLRIIAKYQKQVTQFSKNPLKLLKILKKNGFSKNHLQKIGIKIQGRFQDFTLQKALQQNFLQYMTEIQAVSNDAWNQFHLQQTMNRVFASLLKFRFVVFYMYGKNGNQFPLISNYAQLQQGIDQIIVNLESVQHNPMKMNYQSRINSFYQSSLYITKSLQICQDFQKNFIDIYPIFDSTDIVKQLPTQNKKFIKIYRLWKQLLTYMKKIQSVYDVCNSQNIYEKVKSLTIKVEQIKISLNQYLQQKRKGFSRFYLLSDSQLFQIFSTTNNIQLVCSRISKIFQNIKNLKIEGDYLTQVQWKQNSMALSRPVCYKQMNLQDWLSQLQITLKQTVFSHVQYLMNLQKRLYNKLIDEKCSQALLLAFQADSTFVLNEVQTQEKMQQLLQKQRFLLTNLIHLNKKQKLSEHGRINLTSLLVLILHQVEVLQKFLLLKIFQDKENFQFKKRTKIYIQRQEGALVRVNISSLQTTFKYGFQFLGTVERLVITNLTQRMHIIYLTAFHYCLGGAAMGPAGTGKSQTTKDLANICGKNCLIYNCSEQINYNSLIRIFKGMIVTGIWICFDQFNRLKYELFGAISETLNIIFKYRNFGTEININFHQQTLLLQPSLNFCVTYNPDYQGRSHLPVSLIKMFRRVAMVNIDLTAICKLKLFSYGFLDGNQLAIYIIHLFQMAKIELQGWNYDFGLRTIKSVIDLAGKKLKDSPNSIAKALQILILPKMISSHEKLFKSWIVKYFVKQQETSNLNLSQLSLSIRSKIAPNQQIPNTKLQFLNKSIQVRTGVVVYGKHLSGKQTLLNKFCENKLQQYAYETLFVNAIKLEQLYGVVDNSTKIWVEGVLPKAVRNIITKLNQQSDKYKKGVIICNGSLYPQWIQNLNSVLDNSKVLSLSSGQSIPIPQNLKFIFSCLDLSRATPATISRVGIIYLQQKTEQQLSKNDIYKKIFKETNLDELLQHFNYLLNRVKQVRCIYIQNIYIWNWILEYHRVNSLSLTTDSFVNIFAIIMQGQLTFQGRKMFVIQILLRFSQIQIKNIFNSIFQSKVIQQKLIKSQREWKEFKLDLQGYYSPNINQSNFSQKISPQINFDSRNIFIQTCTFHKINSILRTFLNSSVQGQNKLILVAGQAYSGKSSILQEITARISKIKVNKNKIYLSKSSNSHKFYESIKACMHKKNNKKIGAPPGKQIIFQIQNLQLPMHNNLDINETTQLMRMIISANGWYNYETLQFQQIQDFIMIGDFRVAKKKEFVLQERLYRHIFPMFIKQIQALDFRYIFKSKVSKWIEFYSNSNSGNGYDQNYQKFRQKTFQLGEQVLGLVENLTNFFKKIMKFPQIHTQIFSLKNKMIYYYNIWDFQKIISSLLKWNLSLFFQQKEKIKNLIIFQIQRVMEARLPNQSSINKFREFLSKQLMIQLSETHQNIFHSFNLESNVPHRYYSEKCQKVTDIDKFVRQIQCICEQYNSEQDDQSKKQITVFPQFCLQLCRITRTLSISNSHIILIGLPKSGKKVLLQLVTFFTRGKLFVTQDKYQRKSWYQILRTSTKQCFLQKVPTICLVEDNYFISQQLKQDVNIFLNTFYVKDAYTQADFQELIYIMQAYFMKQNIIVNRQNTRKALIEYLKVNFHMVLSLNPNLSTFKKNLMSYPSLLRHCTLNWLNQWPEQALVLVSKQQIIDQKYQKQNLIAQVHKICKQVTSKTKFKYTWEGQYFEFIFSLKEQLRKSSQQLQQIRQTYVKGLNLINSTQQKLQETKNKIKQLQPGIIHLERQAERTMKYLGVKKSNAINANQLMKQKSLQSEQIFKQAQFLRKQLSQKNLIINENLQKAWNNVGLVKSNHISEIKALNNPSEFIRIVLTAIVIILHDGPIIKQKSEDGMRLQENYFQTAKKYILNKDAKSIASMLTQYKKELVTKQIVWKIQQKCRKHQKWNQKQAKSANKAIFYFFIWVEAIVGYYKLFQETQPLRNQLDKVTKTVQQKTEQIKKIKKELEDYQNQIKKLSDEYDNKKQKLLFYGNQIAQYSKMLHRGQEIFVQIAQQKQKWKNYIIHIDLDIKKLFGDCILRCIFKNYASIHNFQSRNIIFEKVHQLFKVNNIQFNQVFWKYTEQDIKIFKLLQISSNQFVKSNLKTIGQTNKLVFLIDPEQQGIRYLMQKNKLESKLIVNKIQQRSPKLTKFIQQTLIAGRILFIELTSDFLSNQLKIITQVKFGQKSNNDSNDQILKTSLKKIKFKYNGKQFFVSQLAKIYLFTTNIQLSAIDIISNCQTINFSMTPQLLQKRILRIITMIEFPQIQEQIQDIEKENIKSLSQLKEIQSKVLTIFITKTTTELLATDQTLHALSYSNKLFKQITLKMQQAAQSQQVFVQQQIKYENQANYLSKLYFQINKLKELNPVYQYSFKWFVHILQNNFKNFSQNLYKQISSGLPQNSKILAALLIAETYYPKIRWDLLFLTNQKQVLQSNRQKKIDFNEIIGVSFVITSLISNLEISDQYARKIVKKAKQYSQKLPQLMNMLINKPDIFKVLIKSKNQQILTNIPDAFSETEFFSKILLVNCFRSDCTLNLIQDWIKINLGQTFMKKVPVVKYFDKIPKKMPIILITQQNQTQYQKKLFQIFKNMNQYENNIPTILMSTNTIQRLKQVIQGAFENDQWVLIQGIGSYSQELFSQIMEFSQNLDESKFKFFKIFLLVDNVQTRKLPQHFIKYCHKMLLSNQLTTIQKISESFFKAITESSKIQIRQRSQVKYLMSQLCIFHYFLYQKSKRQKQFTLNFNIYDTDLTILKGYTNYFSKSSEQLKAILPNIVKQIIYGSALVNELDINTLKMIIQDIMSLTQVQRQLFWQTLWADQKFPKHQDEYSQYLKQLIVSKQNPNFVFQNYYEMFGLTEYIQNTQKQFRLQKISQFYRKNIYSSHVSTSFSTKENQYFKKIKNKIEKLLKEVFLIEQKLTQNIKNIVKNSFDPSSFEQQKNQSQQLYFFLENQIFCYQKMYLIIKQSLEFHLSLEEPQKDSEIEFYQAINNDTIPKLWKLHNKVSLTVFINEFLNKQMELMNLYNQIKLIPKINLIKQICEHVDFNLSIINNVRSFLNQIKRIFNLNIQNISHGHDMDLIILNESFIQKYDCQCIKISNLYLFNSTLSTKTKLIESIQTNRKQLYRYQTLMNMRILAVKKSDIKQIVQRIVIKNNIKNYKLEPIPFMKYPHEYRVIQQSFDYVYMFALKQKDTSWILRNRVHLTTTI